MKIEKTFTIDAAQQKVWAVITSAEQIAPCIPGCQRAEETAPGKYKASIQTKVGPIKTTFAVDIERTEERTPEFASYAIKGEEGSHASRIKATTMISLKSLTADQTEVSYASNIQIMGRLGKFGSGMMQKIADGVGDEFVAALKDKLEERKAVPGEVRIEKAGSRTALWWAIGMGLGIAALLYFFVF
jgi:carbon monoxide dehydrogenase subunit G